MIDERDAELLANAIHNKFGRYSGMNNPFSGTDSDSGFVRDGSSKQYSTEKVEEELKRFRKTLEDTRTANKRAWKSMLEGIPIYGKFQKVIKSSTDKVEEYSKGQSESFRRSAAAVSSFVHRVGANSTEVDRVTKTLARVQDAAKTLEETAKKRESLGKEIVDLLEKTSLKGRKVATNYQNVGNILADARKKLEDDSTPKKEKADLAVLVANLKELKQIPDSISELRAVYKDKKLRADATKNPELKSIYDEIFSKLESLLKEGGSGKDDRRRAKKIGDLLNQLDELSEVSETLAGAMFGNKVSLEDWGNKKLESDRKLRESMDNLSKSVGAAGLEAFGKEAKMFMTRQRLTGATQAYSLRDEAIVMGISESAALTTLTENRNIIRRMAQDTGDFEGPGGAGRFVESGGLNQMQRYSREMGLMGQEALDNIIKISDDLRVTGLRSTRQNMRGSVDFFRDTFKDLGLTQQGMRDFYAEMSTGGLLRATLADENARLASLEAMQNEVEFRGKLARVLNQELEIQQKRVRELSKLAYGDPAAALKQSFGVEIMARQAGMTQQQAQLLGEQTRTGGASLSKEERQNAATLHGILVGDIGKMLVDAAKGDQLGQRMVLTKFMEMASIDALQAVEAYVRRQTENGEEIDNLTIENIMKSERATTGRGASELGQVAHTIATTIETAQGVLSSAIGNSTLAIVAAIREAAGAAIMGGVSGSMMKDGRVARLIKGSGRLGARALPGIGAVAGAAMTAGSISQAGTAGGSMIGSGLSGAVTGASLGSIIPVVGTALGAGIGAVGGVGLHYLTASSRKKNKEKDIQILQADIATGGFGANTTPEFMKARSEKMQKQDAMIRKAVEEGDVETLQRISFERKFGEDAIEARSIMGNITAVGELEKEAKDASMKARSGTSMDQEQIERRNQAIRVMEQTKEETKADLQQYFSEGRHKKIDDTGTLNQLIEFLNKEVDIEGEEEYKQQMLATLKGIEEKERLNLEVAKDEQQNNMKRFNDMSANEIRTNLENMLAGRASGARNRLIGAGEQVDNASRE